MTAATAPTVAPAMVPEEASRATRTWWRADGAEGMMAVGWPEEKE